MPLPLEDCPERARPYPLSQCDLTLGDLPVVARVSSAQCFLFRTQLRQLLQTFTNFCTNATLVTILLRSSEEDEDLRSLCGQGDFWGTFTLVREPGNEAGGVAESPAVEPEEKKT